MVGEGVDSEAEEEADRGELTPASLAHDEINIDASVFAEFVSYYSSVVFDFIYIYIASQISQK